MSKRNIISICATTLVLLFLCSCIKPAVKEVALDEEFSLSSGQSATVASENISIKFVEVISDSRCQQGVLCIWAGEVSCLVEITYSGIVNNKVLVQPGISGRSETNFNDYLILFDVQPYPKKGSEIKKEDYRLQLVVSRKPALTSGLREHFDVLGERYSI